MVFPETWRWQEKGDGRCEGRRACYCVCMFDVGMLIGPFVDVHNAATGRYDDRQRRTRKAVTASDSKGNSRLWPGFSQPSIITSNGLDYLIFTRGGHLPARSGQYRPPVGYLEFRHPATVLAGPCSDCLFRLTNGGQ